MDIYEEIEAVNFSKLKLFAHSPAAFVRRERVDSAALAYGRALHCAVLEPSEFTRLYTVQPDHIQVRRGREWDAFVLHSAGREILRAGEMAEIVAAVDLISGHPRASESLASCPSRERIITGTIRGVAAKARLDMFGAGRIGDLKTSRDISVRAWTASVMRYHYLAQAAWYLDVATSAGLEVDRFFWLTVEGSHDCAVVHVPDDAIEYGRALYDGWLDRYIECHDTGEFPGVDGGGELVFALPTWAQARDDEDVEFEISEVSE